MGAFVLACRELVRYLLVPRRELMGMDWLRHRMDELGLDSLEVAANRCDLNRGNLFRYFNMETRPSIDVLPKLCEGLEASPLEVLKALGIQVSDG